MLTVNKMTEMVTHSTEPTENKHQICSFQPLLAPSFGSPAAKDFTVESFRISSIPR